jgi:hypothetical protein
VIRAVFSYEGRTLEVFLTSNLRTVFGALRGCFDPERWTLSAHEGRDPPPTALVAAAQAALHRALRERFEARGQQRLPWA